MKRKKSARRLKECSDFIGIFSLTHECTCFRQNKNNLNNKNKECDEGGWADKIISVFINAKKKEHTSKSFFFDISRHL